MVNFSRRRFFSYQVLRSIARNAIELAKWKRSERDGTRRIADLRAKIESLFQGTAESTAFSNQLIAIVESWPSLEAAKRAKILNLAVG
jgi:hypothetical protein